MIQARRAVVVVGVIAGCLTTLLEAPLSRAAHPLAVVAAENFYADIAQQVGGPYVAVNSIIHNPTIDPHQYEPTAHDVAMVAGADIVVMNGLGYDGFALRLLRASARPNRKVIVAGTVTGHRDGDNPHIWYDPKTMPRVARAIAEAIAALDPTHQQAVQKRLEVVEKSLAVLRSRIASLRARFHGLRVEATEPVFEYMADALGLHVITSRAFQKAVEAGSEPPAIAVAQVMDQLNTHQAALMIFNTQTVTPLTTRVRDLAHRRGIPVVDVTETQPPGLHYQEWMLAQLRALEAAASHRRTP